VGEGTQRQLQRSGAGFRRFDRPLLTHGHFDHVLGIPGLFSTLRLQKSADVIRIHGGRGTLVVVAAMLAGFWREGSAPIPLEFVPLTEGRRIIDAGSCGRKQREATHLTHISGRYPEEDVQAEATRIFPNSRVAADFDRIVI